MSKKNSLRLARCLVVGAGVITCFLGSFVAVTAATADITINEEDE